MEELLLEEATESQQKTVKTWKREATYLLPCLSESKRSQRTKTGEVEKHREKKREKRWKETRAS